jgi:Rab-GTPase-TBC domain
MDDVLALLVARFDLREAQFIDPIFRLVAAEYDGHNDGLAMVFFIFDTILRDKDRFADFGSTSLNTLATTFRDVLQKNMPQTSTSLSSLSALESKYLGEIFVDFFKTMLSPADVLQVVDAYLLEGTIVLFEYGLGLVYVNKKQIKQNVYKTADDFWTTVRKEKARTQFDAIRSYAFDADVPTVTRVFSRKRFSLSGRTLMSLGMANAEMSGSRRTSASNDSTLKSIATVSTDAPTGPESTPIDDIAQVSTPLPDANDATRKTTF